MSEMKLSEAPIPLSQAIRLGSMLRPQVFGEWFAFGGSCAEAAAAEATGVQYEGFCGNGPRKHCSALWPEFAARAFRCPAGCKDGGGYVHEATGMDILAHLNDSHRWSREAIADWVETIEQAQSSALVPRSAENIMEKVGYGDQLILGKMVE